MPGKLRTGNISSGQSLCLGAQVALSIDLRWKAASDRGDAAQVIVADIPKHHALHFITAHSGRVHWVELLVLQCGKEALHTCIVVAAAGPTHALNELVSPDRMILNWFAFSPFSDKPDAVRSRKCWDSQNRRN